MVGLPGLGKSSMVAELVKTKPYAFVYSTDTLIEIWAAEAGLTYNDVFSDRIKEATEKMDKHISVAIPWGVDIIWDQTNLSVKKRGKIVKMMLDAGYSVDCVCIVSPDVDYAIRERDAWKNRLENRHGKTIPPKIMQNMIASYVPPSLGEGFDSISFYNMYGSLIVKTEA